MHAIAEPVAPTLSAEQELRERLARSGLHALRLGGRTLLPIVQGGMGVGVSAHRLAGSVAALGGVGTLSSVDLRRHHPDLMERTRGCHGGTHGDADKAAIDAANLEALDREIAAARTLAQGRGLLAVNVMRAVSAYAASVTRALQAGIDAVVVGAGLPLDLPDLARDFPQGPAGAHPVGRARRAAGGEEVGTQAAPARRHRHRAPALRRRPPGRGQGRRPARPALRLRERDPADAGLPARPPASNARCR